MPEYLSFCCLARRLNNTNLPVITKYNGGILPIEVILDERKRLNEKILKNIETSCKGCPNLEKKEWETNNYLFNNIIITHWTNCNLYCDYCYTTKPIADQLPKIPYDVYPAIKDMIDNHYNAPKTKITWGGGELTVLKNFEKIMDLLIQNDFKQSICTNAIIYSEAIARGLKLNKLSVCISVDSGTRETYYKIKGKDTFNAVWGNIAKYDMSKKTSSVKYILKQNNSDEKDAKNFVHLCKENDVKRIMLGPEVYEKINNKISNKTIQAANIILKEAEKAAIEVDISYFPSDVIKSLISTNKPKSIYQKSTKEVGANL